MLVTDKPVTVDDAELLGWTDLEIRCRCRITVLSFVRLKRRTRFSKLIEIRDALRCEACGNKPGKVLLHKLTYPFPRGSPESVTEAI